MFDESIGKSGRGTLYSDDDDTSPAQFYSTIGLAVGGGALPLRSLNDRASAFRDAAGDYNVGQFHVWFDMSAATRVGGRYTSGTLKFQARYTDVTSFLAVRAVLFPSAFDAGSGPPDSADWSSAAAVEVGRTGFLSVGYLTYEITLDQTSLDSINAAFDAAGPVGFCIKTDLEADQNFSTMAVSEGISAQVNLATSDVTLELESDTGTAIFMGASF